MAKLSKQQIITNLIEIYGSDTTVRDTMIPQIKAEIEREQEMLSLPAYDWTYMRLSDKFLETRPDLYFTRLMEIYYSNKGDKWLRELYKRNITELATTN
jgi:hypothetical protein